MSHTSRFTLAIAISIAMAPVSLMSAPNAATNLSGTLQSTAGRPLRASLTLHDLSTTRTAGQTPFDRQFATKSDGAFTLPSIPAGKYQICVDAPQENVLDPCIWSTPTVVTVSGSAPVTGISVQVDTGYTLNVQVNDPQGLLPPAKGGVAGPALSLGVITRTNRYVNLRLLGAASALSRNHYIVIPLDQALTLSIASATLALSDASGVRYKGDALNLPIHVAAGASMAPVVVNVSKR